MFECEAFAKDPGPEIEYMDAIRDVVMMWRSLRWVDDDTWSYHPGSRKP